MKYVISGLFAAILMLVPLSVQATVPRMQEHVTRQTVHLTPLARTETDITHGFHITWERPPLHPTFFPTGFPAGPGLPFPAPGVPFNNPWPGGPGQTPVGWLQFPDRYLVQFINSTVGETAWPPGIVGGTIPSHQHGAGWEAGFADVASPPLRQDVSIAPVHEVIPYPAGNFTRTFPRSSFIEMRVMPRRYAPVWTPDPGPVPIWSVNWAQVNPPEPNPYSTIILSDIRVHHAEASTETLTVYFFDPGTVRGTQIITAWNISWRPANPNPDVSIPIAPTGPNSGSVLVPASEVTPVGGGLVRVSIYEGLNFDPAAAIEVRVEPWRHQSALRTQLPNFPISGTNFFFAAAPLTHEFRFPHPVVVEIRLDYDWFGTDIRLFWTSLLRTPNVTRVEVLELFGEYPGDYRILGILHDEIARTVNEELVPPDPPARARTFMLRVFFGTSPVYAVSNTVTVDPSVVGYDPYAPTIHMAVPDPLAAPAHIRTLEFLAFSRPPYTVSEQENVEPGFTPAVFVDRNMYYRVFVTDNFEDLGHFDGDGVWRPGRLQLNNLFIGEVHANQLDNPALSRAHPGRLDHRPHFEWPTELVSFIPSGASIPVAFEGNRSYYIMIIAQRTNEAGERLEMFSLPAFYRVFMPPFGGTPVPAQVLARPPLRVNRPQMIRDWANDYTHIPLEWDLRYFEIAEPNVRMPDGTIQDVWHSGIAVNNGEVLFGRAGQFAPNTTRQFTSINEILMTYGGDIITRLTAAAFDPHNAAQAAPMIAEAVSIVESWIATTNSATPANNGRPFAMRIVDLGRAPPTDIAPWDDLRARFYVHAVSLAQLRALAAPTGPHATIGDEFEAYLRAVLYTTGGRPDPSNPLWQLLVPGDDLIAGVDPRTRNIVGHLLPEETRGAQFEPDTTYAIFMFPERLFPHVPGTATWEAMHATYLLINTPSDARRPSVIPTVMTLIPVLDPDFTTDSSIGVRWRIQGDFGRVTYNIRFSELLADYYQGGFTIYWDDPNADFNIMDAIRAPNHINPSGVRTVGGFEYIFLRIDYLFLDTDYYVWGLAINDVGEPARSWSSPVMIRTLPLVPPQPPRNPMRAPANIVNVANLFNQPDPPFGVNEPDALNITFMRSFEDLAHGGPRSTNGTATGGAAISPGLPEMYDFLYFIRFTGLQANTDYFMRARTILTVSRTAPGAWPITRAYAYEIQIATNPDFLDAIIFIIPTTDIAAPGNVNVRQAFSVWVLREFRTGFGDDFDGIHRPEQFPLPDRDWEFIYDPLTQTLTFRFRTNQIGADGRPDQQADQRFISRITAERLFMFEADLTDYLNQPITNRIVIVPLSIIRAFNERGITFNILADDITLSIPPRAFETAAMQQAAIGIGTYFHIHLSGQQHDLPTLPAGMAYVTLPKTLDVFMYSGANRTPLSTFASPLGVSLSMDSHIAPAGVQTASLFASGVGFSGWQQIPSTFSFAQNSLTGTTSRPFSVAGVMQHSPPPLSPNAPQTPGNLAFESVSRRLTFADMSTFNPNAHVSANQMNNIMNALVRSESRVVLGAQLTPQQMTQLTNARMAASGTLTYEQAVDILLRLYELRTGWQNANPQAMLNEIPGASSTSPEFVRSIRAGADIGFVSGPIDPRGPITMGQLMIMIDVFLRDTN